MSLEKVKKSVLDEAKAEAEKIKEAAEKKAAAQFAEAEERLKREHGGRLARGLQEIDEKAALEVQRARTEKAKQILALKNEAINRVFEAARERLKALPQAEYERLLTGWLVAMDPAENGEVVFNRKDRESVASGVVAQANQQLGREAYRLSAQTLGIDGGFMFRAETFELDRTFDTMLKQLRSEMVSDLAAEMFKE